MTHSGINYNLFGITRQKGLADDVKFHTHFQYEIFVFHNGHVNYAIGNRVYDLQPGDIIVLDGSVMHRPFVQGDARFYERSIVQFSRDWIAPALQGMKLQHLLQPFEEDHFQVIRSDNLNHVEGILAHIANIERLLQEKNADFVHEKQKLELVHILILLNSLKNKWEVGFNNELNDKYTYIQQIVRYIELNFQKKFTLDDISTELSISKSYLVHLFKELTGQTIMDYAMSYRLNQAKHQLAIFPDLTNQEVGSRCGFENASHFSRYFKKAVGVTPRDFRKQYQ